METTGIKVMALALCLTACGANAQDRDIPATQLPAAAQTFIKNSFNGQAISKAFEDKDLLDTEYKAILANGIVVEFDSKGNWEEIDGGNTALPEQVLPKAVNDYVTKNYAGSKVKQIDKNNRGYEVELTNGTDLDFDSKGNFLRIDD